MIAPSSSNPRRNPLHGQAIGTRRLGASRRSLFASPREPVRSSPPLRRQVAIVEDDIACARACQAELRESGWESVWLSSAAEAVRASRAGAIAPYVLMDLRLPDECAFTSIGEIRRAAPQTAIVAFTAYAADEYVFEALRAGAVGYVLKHDAVGALTGVLDEVRSGGAPMTPGIARRVIESLHVGRPRPPPEPALTSREREVLQLLARGLSYGEAATSLGVSLDTVRTHVRHAYEKLHASTKAEAVAIAMRRGWLD